MPKIIENLENRLLEEARRQIGELGYSGMTVRSVAKGCGVGVGTVYNYFPSKDALLATYMLADWKACMDVIDRASETSDRPEAVVACISSQLCAYAREHESIFRDAGAAANFAGSFSRYHSLLRSQLAKPLEKFCAESFAPEFIAEALLTWTMAGKDWQEIHAMVAHLFR